MDDREIQASDSPLNPNSKSLKEDYREALLKSGIQAAQLLNELIELKIMPDPRAKEMAEVALELIKTINSTPDDILKFQDDRNSMS
ncbi:hypothetical protein [Baaleninema simplex]|uniref:hypothetical protein n=1 Tax=Baaleninema simplex TaxID=2862350 RepID=UPI00034C5052|nr:hypothetical protein [Baaleninema simplex]